MKLIYWLRNNIESTEINLFFSFIPRYNSYKISPKKFNLITMSFVYWKNLKQNIWYSNEQQMGNDKLIIRNIFFFCLNNDDKVKN